MSGEIIKSVKELSSSLKIDMDNIIDNQIGDTYATKNELISNIQKIVDILDMLVNDNVRTNTVQKIEEIKKTSVSKKTTNVVSTKKSDIVKFKAEISLSQNRFFIDHMHTNIKARCEPTLFEDFIYNIMLPIFNKTLYDKTKTHHKNDVIEHIQTLYNKYDTKFGINKVKTDSVTINGIDVTNCLYDEKTVTKYRNMFITQNSNEKQISFDAILDNDIFMDLKKQLPTLNKQIITDNDIQNIKKEYSSKIYKYLPIEYFN